MVSRNLEKRKKAEAFRRRDRRPSSDQFNRVADFQRAGFRLVDQVLSENHVCLVIRIASIKSERSQRLPRPGRGGLIGGGDNTACAGTGGAKDNRTDSKAPPGVLFE